MIKPINNIRIPEQAAILRIPAKPVVGFPDASISELVQDLIDTCLSHLGCVGLSSNQIWETPTPAPAIFVARGYDDRMWIVINPEIDKAWKKEIVLPEGCMSVPGLVKKVTRPKHIQVSYYDVDGTFNKDKDLFENVARIFMHETEHLAGRTIGD